jgi:hypothetical protein
LPSADRFGDADVVQESKPLAVFLHDIHHNRQDFAFAVGAGTGKTVVANGHVSQ